MSTVPGSAEHLGPPGRRGARRGGLPGRIAVATWEVLAGYLLAGAPLSPLVWNDGFYAFLPPVRAVLMTPAARLGLASVGVALLVMGAWDAAGLITARSSAR